jgi:hypothetical protein
MSVARRIVIGALALAMAGCTSGPRGGPPPGFDDEGGDGGPPRPRVQLFISPSGQPFRAPGEQPYPSAAWFAAADKDRDGRLTAAEFRADAEAWFKVVDADSDGALSMPEATTRWEEELVPEMSRVGITGGLRRPEGGFRGRNELGVRGQGAAIFSLIVEPHPLRGADADFDFTVTAREWRAATDRRFALLDTDCDGAVLAAELPRTPAQAAVRTSRPSTLRREAVGPR